MEPKSSGYTGYYGTTGFTGTFHISGSAALFDIQRLDPVDPFQWISIGYPMDLLDIHLVSTEWIQWIQWIIGYSLDIITYFEWIQWISNGSIEWIKWISNESSGADGSISQPF